MIAILLSTLILAAEPSSPPEAPTPAGVHAAKNADGAQVTCWTERPTGSHVSKRVCATAEQIEKAKRDADQALDNRNVGARNTFGPH